MKRTFFPGVDWQAEYDWLVDALKTKGRIEIYDSVTEKEVVWVREKPKKRRKKK
jgi:hypothetical protein